MSEPSFHGKRLTRRERRDAHKRAQERARARAAAREASLPVSPSPDDSRQRALRHTPVAAVPPVATDAPTIPAWPSAVSPWASPGPPSAPGQFPPASRSPMAQALPHTHGIEDTVDRGPMGRSLDRLEQRAVGAGERLRGTWGARASTIAVVAGLTMALAGLAGGLALGGPVLGHAGRPMIALAGIATLGVGGLWAAKGWTGAARRARAITAALALVLGASFAVGTLTNPVVVHGQVYLSTSTEARSFRLLQEIRADLLDLASADEYLTFNAAQAGAHYDEYATVLSNLEGLSDQYARLADDPGALPDPRFTTLVNQTTSAAYWASRSVASKVEVIKASNAKSQADLATHRAAYAESVILAGEQLRLLAADLNLPLTQMGPTE